MALGQWMIGLNVGSPQSDSVGQMDFIAGGVFELKKRPNKHIDSSRAAKRCFWRQVEAEAPGLKGGSGCYIFVLYNGGRATPWYVGKAERQPFSKEIFAPHKLNHYNEVTTNHKGTPYLFLLPRVTQSQRICKPRKTKNDFIRLLEGLLIGMAIRQNPNLRNTKDTSSLRRLRVHRVINSSAKGRSNNAVLHLKRTLGLM
jgi:hypothetical protein